MANFGEYTDGDDTAIASLEEWTDGTSVVVNLYMDIWLADHLPSTEYEYFFMGGCIEENNYCWSFQTYYAPAMGGCYQRLYNWVSELTIGADAPAIYTNFFDDSGKNDLYLTEEGFI